MTQEPLCVCPQSGPTLCDPMDCIICHVTLSMGLPRQKCWGGLPFPIPGDLSNPEMGPASLLHLLHWQADSLPLSHRGSPNHFNAMQLFQ